MLELDAAGRLARLRWSNKDRGVLDGMAAPDAAAWLDAYGKLATLIASDNYTRTVALPKQTALVVDNSRFLHGRRAYAGSRKLLGVYAERADVDALQRMLEAEAGLPPW